MLWFWIACGAITVVGVLYLRHVIRRWEAEDEFYDRWDFGGWADEVSDTADEALRS